MSKIKMTSNMKGIDVFKKELERSSFHEQVGQFIVREMKALIAAGYSPVEGVGRFAPYSASRHFREAKASVANVKTDRGYERELATRILSESNFYPNSVRGEYPNKAVTPVNLYLSGELMNSLDAKGIPGGVEIGHLKSNPSIEEKFMTNNEGAKAPKVPMRRYLPTRPGEKFVESIQQLQKDLYERKIKTLLGK